MPICSKLLRTMCSKILEGCFHLSGGGRSEKGLKLGMGNNILCSKLISRKKKEGYVPSRVAAPLGKQ